MAKPEYLVDKMLTGLAIQIYHSQMQPPVQPMEPAIWMKASSDGMKVLFPGLDGKERKSEHVFPSEPEGRLTFSAHGNSCTLTFPPSQNESCLWELMGDDTLVLHWTRAVPIRYPGGPRDCAGRSTEISIKKRSSDVQTCALVFDFAHKSGCLAGLKLDQTFTSDPSIDPAKCP